MTSNHKLTGILQGRTITKVRISPGALAIGFGDGSTMIVRTGSDGPNTTTGGVVDKVQQQGTTLVLLTKDGGDLTISLGEETSSVMVRDISGGLEYAD